MSTTDFILFITNETFKKIEYQFALSISYYFQIIFSFFNVNNFYFILKLFTSN